MAPVILRLKEVQGFEVKVTVTAQHRQMLDQVLNLFEIIPDYDLNLMTPHQDLFDITGRVLDHLKEVLAKEHPDLVLVQGDTSTTFAAALAAFYLKIPIGHVEAGLRTRDKYRPFPEEINRRLAGALTDYHFAPTAWARDNLLGEGVPAANIWVTGNTVVDALQFIAAKVTQEQGLWSDYLAREYGLSWAGQRLILVTGHRRENFGPGFEEICRALWQVAEHFADVHLIYPVHLNPQVQGQVYGLMAAAGAAATQMKGTATLQAPGGGCLSLLPPLTYAPFVYLMSQSYLVLTDSGGIQEEAPALGKPVLVMREVTERPEGIWAGTVKLVGTKRERIFREVKELLETPASYQAMAQARNPYGDGRAAQEIVKVLTAILLEKLPLGQAP